MNIAGVDICGANPCRFVAEISNNHNRSLDRALRLIDAAKETGADFVKFQCYTPDELVALRGDGTAPDPWGAEGWTMRSLYEKAQTPIDWFPLLVAHCHTVGIPWFSSVFGLTSLSLLESLNCPAYKVARLDSADRGLAGAVLSRGKQVLVSTDDAFASVMRVNWDHADIGLLYCPAGYPTRAADVHLRRFRPDEYGGVYVGLSSHCLDPLLPVAAVARGCKLIEMHFMLDREPSELESNVSLTQTQFAQMIQDVRRVESMLS